MTTTESAGDAAERVTLLAAYDEQLRGENETPGAIDVTVLGPLRLVTFAGGRGFITYRNLGSADETAIGELVVAALAHFAGRAEISTVEWKTRAHDRAPGLYDALARSGFAVEDTESIMIGPAAALAMEVELPAGITLRRVVEDADVRAMNAMQDEVFGDPVSSESADALIRRLSRGDGVELWVAQNGTEIVSAGRLEPVVGTIFAGIWGGATRPQWRGRGIYRALTAARARSAIAAGKTLINSDSTEFSRPILERSGLLKVSETTPYRWNR